MAPRTLATLILASFSMLALVAQSNTSYDATAGNSGSYNSSFGYYAGASLANDGDYNVFSGYYSGRYNTTGLANTFGGIMSGYNAINGQQNVYLGYRVGYSATTANYNTSLGYFSGYGLTSGTSNVFLGMMAGRSTSTGENNIYLGYYSGYNATGTGNVFIGYQSGYYQSGSNKLVIENTSSSSPLIYGDFQEDFVIINGLLGVGASSFGNGQLVVDGKIRADKVSITTNDFPDYVFSEDYQLSSLEEIESFVQENGHLPGIQSESKVLQSGLSIGELNMKLLEKIEELTLHIIEIEKKKTEIEQINSQLEELIK